MAQNQITLVTLDLLLYGHIRKILFTTQPRAEVIVIIPQKVVISVQDLPQHTAVHIAP